MQLYRKSEFSIYRRVLIGLIIVVASAVACTALGAYFYAKRIVYTENQKGLVDLVTSIKVLLYPSLVESGADASPEDLADRKSLIKDVGLGLDHIKERGRTSVVLLRMATDFSDSQEFEVVFNFGTEEEKLRRTRRVITSHLRKAAIDHITASEVYADESGRWFSVASPIVSPDNTLLGVVEAFKPIGELEKSAHSFALMITAGALTVLFVAAVIIVFLLRRVLYPFQQLMELARKSRSSELAQSPLLTRLDEYGTIARYFLSVVSERENTIERLEDAIMMNLSANKARSDFLQSLSHDLRTPLDGIMTTLGLLELTPLNSGQSRDVETIKSCVLSLAEKVGEMNDFQRLEDNDITIELADFQVRSSIDLLLKRTYRSMSEAGINAVATIADSVPEWVRGDSLRFEQVFANILDIALSEAIPNGSLVISAGLDSETGDSVVLQFGVTNSPNHYSSEEEVAPDISQNRASPNGLLPITHHDKRGLIGVCRRILSAINGELWFDTNAEIGNKIFFSIEFQKVASSQKGTRRPKPRSDVKELVVAGEPSILYVEDNAINQKVTKRLLEKFGCQVMIAESGRVALKLLETEHFNLILMDVHMRQMDGLETTRLIRAGGYISSQVPIIGFSAYSSVELRQECVAAGMNGFLSKPAEPHELVETITFHTTNSASPSNLNK